MEAFALGVNRMMVGCSSDGISTNCLIFTEFTSVVSRMVTRKGRFFMLFFFW
jgi:hypothetical protein